MAVVLAISGFQTTTALAEQLWSVHALGFKVGELRVDMQRDQEQYAGTSAFKTTGVAGILKRIRFDIRATGRYDGQKWLPLTYSGSIDTGRRQSRTALDFSGPVPQKTEGEDAPAVPIPPEALEGAIDPMTMTWLTIGGLRDEPCTFAQTQFDGTRLTEIRFERQETNGDSVTCHGVYDRLGGYTDEELEEIKTSPLSITYSHTDQGWRATRLRVQTRHGKATLHRRD